jgi:hypothetical protein
MPENQQVVFLSDGGEEVRRVQAYLHPNSEHLMDWFPIPMRWTVWQQQTKALPEERLQTTGAAASKQVESIQHWLWHGHVEEALERVANLILDLDLIWTSASNVGWLLVGLLRGNHFLREPGRRKS